MVALSPELVPGLLVSPLLLKNSFLKIHDLNGWIFLKMRDKRKITFWGTNLKDSWFVDKPEPNGNSSEILKSETTGLITFSLDMES